MDTARACGSESVKGLEFLGVEARFVAALERAGVTALNVLQARAIRETAVLHGGNLIVLSPTGSGKTLVAELAMLRAVTRGRAAAMLVPTRALAEEQAALLTARYAAAGLRVVVSTRERTEHDSAIAAGAFDVAVMVYEKFRALMGAHGSTPREAIAGGRAWGQRGMMSAVGLIVLDEFQIVSDGARGADVAMLVSVLAAMAGRTASALQVVAMSAVVAPDDEVVRALARSMGAALLVDDLRPVPLREGVWNAETGRFDYVVLGAQNAARGCSPDGATDSEMLSGVAAGASGHPRGGRNAAEMRAVCALVRELAAQRREQVLVFVPTRAATMRFAQAMADDLRGSACGASGVRVNAEWNAALREAEPCRVSALLRGVASAGVAFHNADLPAALRSAVEAGFRAGAIRVLVATSTLAQGVNLAGRNVVSVAEMVSGEGGADGGTTAMIPISVRRWRNQGGRAGRDGGPALRDVAKNFARSLLVATDSAESRRLQERYLAKPPEALRVELDAPALQRGALLLIAAAGGRGVDWCAVQNALAAWSALGNSRAMEDPRASDEFAHLRAQLLAAQAVATTPDGARLRATGLGEVAAQYGLRLETLAAFADWVRSRAAMDTHSAGTTDTARIPELEILALLAWAADSAEYPMFASRRELEDCVWPAALGGRRDVDAAEFAAPVCDWLSPVAGFCEAEHHMLKRMLVAEAWIGDLPTPGLESEFAVNAGSVASLGAHFSWLCEALAQVARVLGGAAFVANAAQALAARLVLGVSAQGSALAHMRLRHLTRSAAQRLLREGFSDADSLRDFASDPAHADTLRAWVGAPAAEELRARWSVRPAECDIVISNEPHHEHTAHATPTDNAANRSISVAYEPHTSNDALVLRDDAPGQVWCAGATVFLTEMPYRLLRVLARRAGEVVGYPEIDAALWPEAKVERQQVSYHRHALVRALRPLLGARANELVVTEKRLGLRLARSIPVRVEVAKATG